MTKASIPCNLKKYGYSQAKTAQVDGSIKSIRHFNRYYTNRLGLLARYRFDTYLTLTEARVLFEIGRRGAHNQLSLGTDLKIDGGYLNRVIARLVGRGLAERRKSEADGRVVVLGLTYAGREAAARIDEASDEDASALVEGLDEAEKEEVVSHMRAFERILEGMGKARPEIESAERGQAVASARVLMREYLEFLGEDLGFQVIEEELAGLPGKYAPPRRSSLGEEAVVGSRPRVRPLDAATPALPSCRDWAIPVQ